MFKSNCFNSNTNEFYLFYKGSFLDTRFSKPLRCLPFRKTLKYGDWYWYSLHNSDYLRSKCLERNVYYKDNQIFCSDNDFHSLLVAENPLYEFAKMGDYAIRDFVINSINAGISLSDILKSGYIPLQKTQSVVTLYNSIFDIRSQSDISLPFFSSCVLKK